MQYQHKKHPVSYQQSNEVQQQMAYFNDQRPSTAVQLKQKKLISSGTNGVVQRVLRVEGNRTFIDEIRKELNEISGGAGKVSIKDDGTVRLGNNKKVKTPGHRLLKEVINSDKTVTIRTVGPDRVMKASPHLPNNSIFGKMLDLLKSPQFMRRAGYLPHDARAFVNGSTPGVGVDSTVYHDIKTSDVERYAFVRDRRGRLRVKTAPKSIGLGHELIHAMHFQKGLGQYDARAQQVMGITKHTFTPGRGEVKPMEELNTVGLGLLEPGHEFHDHVHDVMGNPEHLSELTQKDRDARLVTENDLRKQMGYDPRAGYEMPPGEDGPALYNR